MKLNTQVALTLLMALASARENNPELRKVEIAADSAGWGKLEALSEHLPHVRARGTHFLGARYSILGVNFNGTPIEFPTAFPQTELEVGASILLFDGLSSINKYRAALSESDAAELELDYARFRLEQGVLTRFNQALAAQDLEKVADQNIETLEQHHHLALASQRAGLSTNVDVLRIETQLEEARAERLLASDNVVAARQQLMEIMGVENDDRPLEGTLPEPDPTRVPKDLAPDLSHREDLQAEELKERAKDRLSAASAGYWLPKVSVFGTEQFYKYGTVDPTQKDKVLPNATFQNAYSYGLSLTWNLFDGGASMARAARATDAAETAAENLRKTRIMSPHEFDSWKRKYFYNTALYGARKRAVEKSTESVRLATLEVKAGTKTHSEALDAELELFRARAGLIRSELDAAEALANLELALGRKL